MENAMCGEGQKREGNGPNVDNANLRHNAVAGWQLLEKIETGIGLEKKCENAKGNGQGQIVNPKN